MFRTLLPFAAAIFVASCSAPSADSLDELIARHTEAKGGAEAIEGRSSAAVDVTITEPAFTVTGHYVARRDGHMRIDIYSDGVRVFTEALNGDRGWQMFDVEGDTADLSPAGEAALRRGIHGNLFGLHELEGLGYEVTLGADEVVDGISYRTIETVAPDGFRERLYLNTDTWMIERTREESALHPDLDPEERHFESVYSDFREVDGIMVGFYTERRDLETGEVVQTSQITSFISNPEIEAEVFERPGQ